MPKSGLIMGLWAALFVLAGCAGQSEGGTATDAAEPRAMPELTEPWMALYSGGEGLRAAREPLQLGRALAQVTGGTWVVATPRPLETLDPSHLRLPRVAGGPVTGMAVGEPPADDASTTMEFFLDHLKKCNERFHWTRKRHYLLAFFGSREEFEEFGKEPVEEVTGLLVTGETGQAMADALADVLRIPLRPDPSLFRGRDLLERARLARLARSRLPTLLPIERSEQYSSDGERAGQQRPILAFQPDERVGIEELAAQFAAYFGGEAREAKQGGWELRSLSEPGRIAQEMERLQGKIQEGADNTPESFSAFSVRAGRFEGAEEPELEAIPPLTGEAAAAMETLLLLGPQALPVLKGYLDPNKPVLAQAAARALGESSLPEAEKALADFEQQLEENRTARGKRAVPALRRALTAALTLNLRPASAAALVRRLRSPNASPAERNTIRSELLASPYLDLLRRGAARADQDPGELEHPLPDPPLSRSESPSPLGSPSAAPGGHEPPPPPPGIPAQGGPRTPFIATQMLPNGEVWAAFLSNRFGTSQDLWLGRSEKGKWIEFLFTGERHGGNQFGAHFYSDSNRTPRGKLVVDGDGVALGPPGGKRAEDPQKLEQEMDQIQQALGEAASRSASPEARRKEMQRLEARMLQIQVGLQQSLTLQSTGVLTGSWSFSLAALRKDDDRDGLTNVVEKRLGLDPKKPDTDGDGTLDGRDVNPLAKPTGASARTRILQGLFDLLLGGDPERRPRYVRLEKGLEQEFYGTRGRVLLLPPEEPLPPGSSGLVELHFAGPRSAEDTLLEREGPCLLNAQRDRAEVNFWLQIAGETSYTGGLMYGVSSGSEDENQSTTGHFVARFRKEAGDQWRAESIRPFRWRLPKPAN